MTRPTDAEQVGVVRRLLRYPVKSMAGEDLHSAVLDWHGLQGDRRYAFVRGDDTSGFPWLTIRQVPAMATYTPILEHRDDPEHGGVEVISPDGRRVGIRDRLLKSELAARYGGPVELVRSKRGLFDVMTSSLLTLQSVDSIGQVLGAQVDALRFRPNILIEAHVAEPFPEERWVGHALVFGRGDDGAGVRVDLRDKRCAVVNFDPSSGAREPGVLRTIARHRDARLGVYATTGRPGKVNVGDPVFAWPPLSATD